MENLGDEVKDRILSVENLGDEVKDFCCRTRAGQNFTKFCTSLVPQTFVFRSKFAKFWVYLVELAEVRQRYLENFSSTPIFLVELGRRL